MMTFNETTRSTFNKRVDLQNQGTQLLWAIYQKYMPLYNPLTLQQIVSNFKMLKCVNHQFETFATKIGTMRAELEQNRKSFLSSEVKNIFILDLGKLFKPVINCHLNTEWHIMDLHKLAIVAEKFKKQQDTKKKLFASSSTSTSNTESNTEPNAATLAMRAWQNAIKYMIASGQLTPAQEAIFEAQQPNGCYYH
eukprot:1094545-Ditylum_brightwellii.AAC.1